MKKLILLLTFFMSLQITNAQNTLTPELLWQLGRLAPLGMSKDGKLVVYKVSSPSVADNKSTSKYYTIPVSGGNASASSPARAGTGRARSPALQGRVCR